MPWMYRQRTGELYCNSAVIGRGYSGYGMTPATGRNNPLMQHVEFRGPIPRGRWIIGPVVPRVDKQAPVLLLTPDGHNAFGRNGFLIHGNNKRDNASEGCIILNHELRQQIANSSDKVLLVLP
jgi:hypothetical protein